VEKQGHGRDGRNKCRQGVESEGGRKYLRGQQGQPGTTIGSAIGARRGWPSPRSCAVYQGGAEESDRGEKPS